MITFFNVGVGGKEYNTASVRKIDEGIIEISFSAGNDIQLNREQVAKLHQLFGEFLKGSTSPEKWFDGDSL